MCQIYVKEAGVEIPLRRLRNAFDNNSDGIGVLWVDNGKVNVIREMASWSRVLELMDMILPYKAVVHFRYGTSGTYSIDNLHPFPLKGGYWLFHNGVLRCVDYHREKNDTRVFVETFLDRLMHKNAKAVLPRLQDLGRLIGKENRMVIVSDTGNIHYVNERTFINMNKEGTLIAANRYSHSDPYVKNDGWIRTTPELFNAIERPLSISYASRVACKVIDPGTDSKAPRVVWARLSEIDYSPANNYVNVASLLPKPKKNRNKAFMKALALAQGNLL